MSGDFGLPGGGFVFVGAVLACGAVGALTGAAADVDCAVGIFA